MENGDIGTNAVVTTNLVPDAVTTFVSTSGFTAITGDGLGHNVLSMSFSLQDARVGTLSVSIQQGYSAEVAHQIDIYVDGSLYATRGSAAYCDYIAFGEPLVLAAGSHSIDIWWEGQVGVQANRRNMTPDHEEQMSDFPAWTIYDPTTGEVITTQVGGDMPEPGPGQARIPGNWPGDLYRIEAGEPVRKPRP